MAATDPIQTRCCIVGGGPAGMMLGLLLARAGIEVAVLEKHVDFFRDFRGDTIHPSTLELMHELGLLEAFLRLPHQEIHQIQVSVNGETFPVADFSRLPTRCKFVATLPQWDFLNFISQEAKRYPRFSLYMEWEVTELVKEEKTVVGVWAKTPEGTRHVQADLVVAADGRFSTVRQCAGLPLVDQGVPIDVLWLRLPRDARQPAPSLLRFRNGRMMVMIDRGDYWQCGVIIPKGGFEDIQRQGLAAFRESIADVAPFLRDRLDSLDRWDAVRLLTVQINRLERWFQAGLLCIGDAAHAMSPAGGVGVNLAIQDAVAAANLLAEPLRQNAVTMRDLERVQKRREWPTRATQTLQASIHRRMISHQPSSSVPLPVRVLGAIPWLRQFPARLIGLGFRPEHVQTPGA